jgi:hypothetical protein
MKALMFAPGRSSSSPDGEADAPLEVQHPGDLLKDIAPVYPRHPDGQPAPGAVVLFTRYGAVPAGGGHGGWLGLFLVKRSSVGHNSVVGDTLMGRVYFV